MRTNRRRMCEPPLLDRWGTNLQGGAIIDIMRVLAEFLSRGACRNFQVSTSIHSTSKQGLRSPDTHLLALCYQRTLQSQGLSRVAPPDIAYSFLLWQLVSYQEISKRANGWRSRVSSLIGLFVWKSLHFLLWELEG